MSEFSKNLTERKERSKMEGMKTIKQEGDDRRNNPDEYGFRKFCRR
jgi:hypothetical protein